MIKTTGFRTRRVVGYRNHSFGDYGTGFYFSQRFGWRITGNPFLYLFCRSIRFPRG